MATVPFTAEDIRTFGDTGHVIAWTSLANGDDGTPLEMIGSADRSVQVVGTFGAGGTVLLEGSNDGTNYNTLHDPGGTALSLTTSQIVAVLEISAFIRPRVSAGDGTTALTVTLLVRRPT
jgi:hypothetical protein